MYISTFIRSFAKNFKIHASLILLHFILLRFTDVAFFYKLKARLSTGKKYDWLYCDTRFIFNALVPNLPYF